MSETAGPHTFWTLADDLHGTTEQYRGAFGHEVPGVSHRIVDAAGHDVAEGVDGEILVRGYSVMQGLYKRERSDVFDADGWYHTDDRGHFRDGWLFFTGRQSDLIKTKGANVAPVEVERVLLSLRGVSAAFVFGVEHPEHGQDVVALVVGGDADEQQLRAALREQLSSYKVPAHIFAIDPSDVAFLTSQKADRRHLAALAVALTKSRRDG